MRAHKDDGRRKHLTDTLEHWKRETHNHSLLIQHVFLSYVCLWTCLKTVAFYMYYSLYLSKYNTRTQTISILFSSSLCTSMCKCKPILKNPLKMQHIPNLAVPSGVQQVLGCFLSVLCALKHDHMARKKVLEKMYYARWLVASHSILPSNVKTPHFQQRGGRRRHVWQRDNGVELSCFRWGRWISMSNAAGWKSSRLSRVSFVDS